MWCYLTLHFRLESHNNNLYKIMGHTFFFYYIRKQIAGWARGSSVCGSWRRYTQVDGGRVQMGRRRMESWHCPRSLKWHQVAGEIDAAAANALLLYMYTFLIPFFLFRRIDNRKIETCQMSIIILRSLIAGCFLRWEIVLSRLRAQGNLYRIGPNIIVL